jgi:hypothetical protein
MSRLIRSGRAAATALVISLAAAGCGGGKYPVHGTVTLDDGTPLTKGLVVFERTDGGPPITARGEVKPDGTYELSTDKPGDGVPTGKYRVLVNALDLSDEPDEQKKLPFDFKYQRFETSGLEFVVTDKTNEYPIKLTRSKKK